MSLSTVVRVQELEGDASMKDVSHARSTRPIPPWPRGRSTRYFPSGAPWLKVQPRPSHAG